MKKYVVLEKPVGQTPLEALRLFQERSPIYKDVPLSYAGRLDPMASGKLLVLIGEECKKQKKYHGLDKEYVIEVLLDIGTDTGDVLGVSSGADTVSAFSKEEIKRALTSVTGKADVPYPVFSSKTVNGKPLFMYALEGTLDSIEIPTHTEEVYSITHLNTETVSLPQLKERVFKTLSLVPRTEEASKQLGADFRQDAVRECWEKLFTAQGERTYQIHTLRVSCASGTYMRTLAGRIGEVLGTKGVALSIHRTRIGSVFGLWLSRKN